ncbi:MAG: ATP-dependent DNA helicase [Nanoarchaeota archaeon]
MNPIKKVQGPCVILAGAGTGKTYTIVEKLKYIISNNIYSPEKIVCITFSNEAANNLTVRVNKILKEIGADKEPIIKTFHGFSSDLLRKYGSQLGISEKFKILDPEQAMVLLHRSLKTPAFYCQKYIPTIGTCKDLGIKIEDFQEYLNKEIKALNDINIEKRIETLNFELQTLHLKNKFSNKKELLEELKRLKRILERKKFITAWNAYEKIKLKGNYQDYSDLNKNALELLEKNPEISKEFDYIIVDEFQDTNKLQLDFLFRLSRNNNITIVGDINQSIYRFRGAYKDNLYLFKKHFSVNNEDLFNLDKSFRSSNKILKVAHKLISNNYSDKNECFFVENAHCREGDNIEIYELKNQKEEARKIVELVKRELEQGTPEDEICILFRAHQNGRIIKRVLESKGIKTISLSKPSLLKQKSVKTVLDYLNILEKIKKKTKGAENSWWDIAYQFNFSQEDLIKLGKKIKELLSNFRSKSEETEEQKKAKESISIFFLNNFDKIDFSEEGKLAAKILIEKIKSLLPSLSKPLSELVKDVSDMVGLREEPRTKEERESIMNLGKLIEIAKMHEEFYDSELENFIYYLNILEVLEIDLDACQLEESGVRLMTSHSTKGLEYKVVIITNMAQGRFPIERYSGNSLIPTDLLPEIKNEIKGLSNQEKEDFVSNYEKHQQILEERRLAYVSFTRAKEKLILTYAKNYNDKEFAPSSFLKEIDYKKSPETIFIIDELEKFIEPEVEITPASSLTSALNSKDFELKLNSIVSENNSVKREVSRLSPSSLKLFDECQKKFEYKYLYNMPDKKPPSWEALKLGSFIHLVLEKGVSLGFKSAEKFLEFAKELSLQEDWADINFEETETLIKVFFERNKGRYNEKTKTEQSLFINLEGFEFMGFADRIDFSETGAEIIDYKTGKTPISPKERNWQLGYYALAAKERYGTISKVVLDMLKLDKPLEFVIDEKGEAVCITSDRIEGFNIYQVKDELIEVARRIQKAHKSGFKPCPVEKNCDFCNEYVYGL